MEHQFNDFLSYFNNSSVEVVDPTNRNQCFDLAVAWCMWLGLPQTIFAGLTYAYQIYTNPTKLALANFDFIVNTPDAIPGAGDMPVWDKKYNGSAGHVGIATGKGNLNTFECFEQNDPTGSVSHVRTYTYSSILGWLHYKFPNSTPMNDALPKKLTDHHAEWKTADDILKYEQSVNDNFTKKDNAIKALGLDPQNLQSSFDALIAKVKADCQADQKPDKYSEIGRLFVEAYKKSQAV